MALEFSFDIPPGGFVTLGGELKRLAENLALDVSDRAARKALTAIRADMAGAGLGRLGFGLGASSDKSLGKGVYREGDTVRASGNIHIRSRSERTVGAIISYTEGSNILPVKGRWLWFPTDDAYRLARLPIPSTGKGRKTIGVRMTPALYNRTGLDRKIGPLIRLRSVNGNPILAVKNVGVSQVAGGRRRARGLTKSGRPRKGDSLAELVVMFIGIPRTSRAARVNVRGRAFEAAQRAVAELRGV